MARARRGPDLSVSLFPFLSVLACVIGTLTLVIAALALSQVVDDLDTGDVAFDAHEQLAIARGALAELETRIAQARETQRQLDSARAELRALGVPVDEPDFGRTLSLQLESARLAREVEELEREQQQLARATEAAKRQLAMPQPETESPPITILPAGPGEGLEPWFVECRRDAIRLHRHDRGWRIELQLGNPTDKGEYIQFLGLAKASRGATVIFLIRPDGVATYKKAEAMAHQRAVRHAKLPLPGDGELDFSFF